MLEYKPSLTDGSGQNTKNIKKSVNKDIVPSLQQIVGMIGTKLNLMNQDSMAYQSWDCITTKHSKVENWCKSSTHFEKVVKFSRGSFFKSYPLLFDSSNLDPTKTWMMGCQIAAINVQSLLDDYTLINQVYFTRNKNSGYILKSEGLREAKVQLPFKQTQKVSIEFLTGSMLHTLSQIQMKELNITLEIRGSPDDDKANPKYNFTKITERFINPTFVKEKVDLKIYNNEVTCVLIKLYEGSNLVGRSVIPIRAIMSGFRIIPIYDNECKLTSHAYLTCLVKISEI